MGRLFTPEECAEFAKRALRLGYDTQHASSILAETMMALKYEVTEGADVLYRLCDRAGDIVDRPAKIVKVWRDAHGKAQENGLVNLVVFVDGSNDVADLGGRSAPIIWCTSVLYSADWQGSTWHWPAA